MHSLPFLILLLSLSGLQNSAAAEVLKCDAGEGAVQSGWTAVFAGFNSNVGGTEIDVTLATGAANAIAPRNAGGSGPLADLETDFYFADDQVRSPEGDFILTLGDLTAGIRYKLLSYHTREGEQRGTSIGSVTVTGATEVSTPGSILQSHDILENPAEILFTAGSDDVVIRYESPDEHQAFFNGFTLEGTAFSVVDTTPVDGAILAEAPDLLTVSFSEALDGSTLQASDLKVGERDATSVNLDGVDRAVFGVPTGLGLGVHTVSIVGAAMESTSGKPVAAYSGQFRVVAPPALSDERVSDLGPSWVTIDAVVSENPRLWIYYGTEDGGMDPSAWDGVRAGGIVEDGPISVRVTGLISETLYHARVRVRNAAGEAWSTSSLTFTTEATPPAYISEFLAVNDSTLADEDGDFSDWIEICNPGTQETDFGGWYLTDDPLDRTKWQLPSVTIPRESYLVVFASGKDRASAGDELHANFQLNGASEYLALIDPQQDYTFEYSPTFPEQTEDISYGVAIVGGEPNFFSTPTPGAPNEAGFLGLLADLEVRPLRGFYEEPFEVTLSSSTPGTEIRYTTNGSAPTEEEGELYTEPLLIDGTTTLRAAAFKEDFLPSAVTTHTYLFLEDVIRQSQMDQGVVNSPAYADSIIDGMTSIPTLSIVMNEADFSNLQTQDSRSRKEELPSSVELLYAQDLVADFEAEGKALRDGFQIDCAIEGHSWAVTKRSFRLKFKRDFGPAKLNYPFFETAPTHADSATGRFDRIILRAGKNNSWAGGRRDEWTGVRDPWVRDAQIPMSGIGTRSLFVHLYVNGRYWGIFNPAERADQRFTSAYLGGDEEDWFATNHGIERGGQHLSGDSSRFERMVQLAERRNLENPSDFDEFRGLLNVEQFSDYVTIFWFSGFGDGLDNNWYGGMRNHPPEGYMMFMWDGEATFLPGNDNLGAWVPPYFFSGNTTIIKLWVALLENEDFRMVFADRIYKHCFNGGALTDENALARLGAMTDFIEDAVIGESARWGSGRTRNDHWRPAVADLEDAMDGNVEQFITALRGSNRDLYPSIDPPTFHQHGGTIPSDFSLTLNNPNAFGTIYYTLDGSDPRLQGGTVSPEADVYAGPIALNAGGRVRARVRSGDTWSALNDAVFSVVTPRDALRISEVMYHSSAGASEDFIELENSSDFVLDLAGVTLTDGISYAFAPGTTLGPGEFVVLVSDAETFAALYPDVTPAGQYGGNLADGGERLTLRDAAGLVIASFEYDDEGHWPIGPDGFGYSLIALAPDLEPRYPSSWRASADPGGSPGKSDPSGADGGVMIHEILTASSAPLEDAIELYNPTSGEIDIGGWFLSDSRAGEEGLRKYRIPNGTVIAAGGYLAVYELEFNGEPGSLASFALDSSGDAVYLASADNTGNLTGHIVGHEFEAAEVGVSLGVYTTSTGPSFTALSERTFGADDPESLEEFRGGPGAPNAVPWMAPVVISELHYHPLPGEPEFIEFQNRSDEDVALYDASLGRGWQVDGVRNVEDTGDYEFSVGAVVPAGGFMLLVPIAPEDFRDLYGLPPSVAISGPYGGGLANGGEVLQLLKPLMSEGGEAPYSVVDHLRYDDEAPWSLEADGEGPSLERVRTFEFAGDPLNWESSRVDGGSPGAPNSVGESGPNQPPRASFVAIAQAGEGALHVPYLLDASDSIDSDGSIVSYEWVLGDGNTGNGEQLAHDFTVGSTFTVRLTVTDSDGASASTVRRFTSAASAAGGQIPGDSNQDGVMDISDPVSLLALLFLGGTALPCGGDTVGSSGNRTLLDLNVDDEVDLTDAIYLLNHLFNAGPPPLLGTDCVPIAGCADVCTF